MAHKGCFDNAIRMIRKDKEEQLEEKKKKQKEVTKEKKKSSSRPKAELKDGLSDEEYLEKRKFYEYVKELKGLGSTERLPAKVYALCDKYTSVYGFTWEGMYQTLKYLLDIKKLDLTGDIVGIIPHCYDETERYYKELEAIENANKDVDINKLYSERVIQIIPKKRKIKQLDF